jgi:hypothetical protein
MSIAIHSSVPLVAIQGVTAEIVLQPGTVISAQVQQVLGNGEVQISIGGQPLQVTSQVPLQAGQSLQLAVSQGADGTVRLAVVNQPPSATSGATSSSTASAGASVNPGLANLASTIAASDTALLATAIAGASTVGATSNPLSASQAIAVSAAAQTAATQQAGLAPLFANLEATTGLSLPPQVQQAAALVLAQRVGLDQGLTGNDIKQAFQSSGLFLEASLASGSLSSSSAAPDLKASLIVLRQVLTTALNGATTSTTPTSGTATTTPTIAPQVATAATTEQPGAAPAIIVVEQGAEALQVRSSVLTITAGAEPQTTASPALAPPLASEIAAGDGIPQAGATAIPQAVLEFSAANAVLSAAATPADAAVRTAATGAALNLLQETVQANPLAGPLTASSLSGLLANDGQMLSLLPAVAGVRLPVIDDALLARTNVPPPPVSGALPAPQPVMPATLSGNSSPEAAMHHLLTDTDSAIARQTLLQVASLPDQVDSTAGRIDPNVPRWNFEIPFVTAQGTAMAQFEISRDGGAIEKDAKRIWRAKFSLDVEPAGPVHAQISLSGERTSVRMWAERPATAEQLRAGVTQLSQALSRAELLPGDIVVRDGAPVPLTAARAGHFLDRAL